MKSWKPLLAAGLLSLAGTAQAAGYPERPLRMLVGFPAGGASDVAARAVAAKMEALLGQPVVVENKPGAASNIASDAVAKAKPDGYTMLFGTISLSINGSLYKSLPYDPVRDLTPVSQLSSAPFLLVVNPKSPIHSVADLIDTAKHAEKGRAPDYATAGNGSGSHLFMELFSARAGIELSHVPYRGAAPAMADVLGGQVPLTFDNIITTLPLIETGKLRALAVSSAQRSPAAPDIPTLAELGVKDYDATSWFGLFVPAGTPPDIVSKLGEAAVQAVKTPEVSATLRKVGAEPVGSTPAEFAAFFKEEVAKWAEVVQRANVQID
ncbi:tripartite tricarboxylate transporter substrate binding protein [Bordetella sp. BOR01]|uniref:Bug family tripartite tricarboxylate transporter substrate binding protein n=1 Tax=Bordetella sp. BOR01 TaxID=2854779 RepID=UPI001C44ECD1|nr:tripartite tricarboxylate transporter substrate binding protein [Bordetella sp. BOR01]MBV7485467.1 tripartite tricarboxylate transporter substrate binding protein [Bordetella sp. BOR01]